MSPRLNTTQRGLGRQHQKRRAALLRMLVAGAPCGHCGKPMYSHQDLDADHSVPRSKGGTHADRLLHAACNRSRGSLLWHDRHKQPPKPITSREW